MFKIVLALLVSGSIALLSRRLFVAADEKFQTRMLLSAVATTVLYYVVGELAGYLPATLGLSAVLLALGLAIVRRIRQGKRKAAMGHEENLAGPSDIVPLPAVPRLDAATPFFSTESDTQMGESALLYDSVRMDKAAAESQSAASHPAYSLDEQTAIDEMVLELLSQAPAVPTPISTVVPLEPVQGEAAEPTNVELPPSADEDVFLGRSVEQVMGVGGEAGVQGYYGERSVDDELLLSDLSSLLDDDQQTRAKRTTPISSESESSPVVLYMEELPEMTVTDGPSRHLQRQQPTAALLELEELVETGDFTKL